MRKPNYCSLAYKREKGEKKLCVWMLTFSVNAMVLLCVVREQFALLRCCSKIQCKPDLPYKLRVNQGSGQRKPNPKRQCPFHDQLDVISHMAHKINTHSLNVSSNYCLQGRWKKWLGIGPGWPVVNCVFLGQAQGGMVQMPISKKDTHRAVFSAASAMTSKLPDGAALLECKHTSH